MIVRYKLRKENKSQSRRSKSPLQQSPSFDADTPRSPSTPVPTQSEQQQQHHTQHLQWKKLQAALDALPDNSITEDDDDDDGSTLRHLISQLTKPAIVTTPDAKPNQDSSSRRKNHFDVSSPLDVRRALSADESEMALFTLASRPTTPSSANSGYFSASSTT